MLAKYHFKRHTPPNRPKSKDSQALSEAKGLSPTTSPQGFLQYSSYLSMAPPVAYGIQG